MKFIINLIELYIIIRVLLKVCSFFIGGRFSKKNKSIASKIFTLISRDINHRLDGALKKQGEKFGYVGKVIPMKYKRRVKA